MTRALTRKERLCSFAGSTVTLNKASMMFHLVSLSPS